MHDILFFRLVLDQSQPADNFTSLHHCIVEQNFQIFQFKIVLCSRSFGQVFKGLDCELSKSLQTHQDHQPVDQNIKELFSTHGDKDSVRMFPFSGYSHRYIQVSICMSVYPAISSVHPKTYLLLRPYDSIQAFHELTIVHKYLISFNQILKLLCINRADSIFQIFSISDETILLKSALKAIV